VVVPIGGHGVFLDARSILSHVPQERFPAQALAAAIYVDSGVREPLPQAGAGALGHPASRVHPGPYGRGCRVGS
jgi:tryptophanase